MKKLIAVLFGLLLFATATGARADGAAEKADCQKRLEPAYKTIEKDYHYAQAWTDSWIWLGSTLVVLNLTQAFMVDDYKRGEALTLAATSTLLMIQRPVALTSGVALQGIKTAALEDPCLALDEASHVLKANQIDGEMHRAWPLYLIPVGFNLAVMGILAAVTNHFDFVGDSNLGLQTLVGIGLSELAVYTYPSGSLKTTGTSLEVSF